MNRSLFSLVLLFGAVSAGGTALVPDCTPTKCRAVTTCDGKLRPVSAPCAAVATPATVASPAQVCVTSPSAPRVAIATTVPLTTSVTTPVVTTLRPSLRTRAVVATPTPSVAVAAPTCSVAVVATPVACDPELLRSRALARARVDGQCCSPKSKKKAKSSCTTTTREHELAYEEAVTRAGEEAARAGEEAARAGEEAARAGEEAARAGEEAARVHEVRAWANGGGAAELKALHELAQQGHCSQKALAELAERAKCSGEAVRELTTRDRLSAAQRDELVAHAHQLAEAGEHMRALHAEELAAAQAYADSDFAAFERDSASIREKVRSALGKLGRKHDESADDSDAAEDESADDEVSWDDDSEEDANYAEAMSDEDDGDDDDQDSSLEARIERLEALARERGHDVDEEDDDSKSLEERVESLERLMRGGGAGVYNFRALPRMRLEALKGLKEYKQFKDWPRVTIGDDEVLVIPDGNWPVPSAPNAKSPDVWYYPQKDAKPGKPAPKAKAYKWYWPSKDDDSDDEVDVPEPPEAPEPPEPADVPDVPDVPDAFAPFAHGGAQHGFGRAFAPGANAEARREIESLMRDMRSQIDSMRTEMERLREELVRASKRGAR